MYRICRVLVLLIVLMPGMSLADKILLSNGRTIEGRILTKTDEFVRLEAGGIITRLTLDSIISIEEAEDFENSLLAAEAALQRRSAVRGIEALFEALAEGAPKSRITEVLEKYNGGISGAIHSSSPDGKASIRRSLRDLMDEDLLTSKTLYMASQHFFTLDDWESTAEALERIPTADIRRDPQIRLWALDIMRQLVKRSLANDDYEQAIFYVERMRRITNENEAAQVPLADLARSAAERERNHYGESLRIIAEELSATVPGIARNRSSYTIEKMIEWARETNNYEEARAALEHIRDLFPVEYAEARNRIVLQEARYLMDNAEPNEALNLIESIPSQERGDIMKRLYKKAFHESELTRLDETQPLELLKHGQWCLENGLIDEAIRLFNETRQNPNLRDVSDQFLTNARRVRDTEVMLDARELYDQGDMIGVLENTQRIITNPTVGSALKDEAERLNELAKSWMKRENDARGPRAEVFYQRAERAHYLQEHEESLQLLELILRKFPDTPAASRAADLLPFVIRALELSYLEGSRKNLPRIPEDISLDDYRSHDEMDAEIRRLIDALDKGA